MRLLPTGNPLKSFRFWLIFLLISYTLTGFFLVPYLVKTQLVNYVEGELDQRASLEAVRFNPFLLRLQLDNLHVEEPDQAPLFSIAQLSVDFDSFGVFRRAWRFNDIVLTELDVFVELDTEGHLNLAQLTPPATEPADQSVAETPAEPEASPIALPRLILENIEFNNAHFHYREQTAGAEPFNLQLNDINLQLGHISTLPVDGGEYHIKAHISDQETLAFDGSIQLAPLDVAGHVALANLQLGRAGDYMRDLLEFTVTDGTLSISTDFTLNAGNENDPAGAAIAVKAENIAITIDQLQLDTLAPVTSLIAISTIALNNGQLAWPAQRVIADSLIIEQGSLQSWLTSENVFNYTQLVKPSPQTATTDEESDGGEPWSIQLEQFLIKQVELNFEDRSLNRPAQQTIAITELAIGPVTLEPEAEFDLTGSITINNTGSATINGKVGALPPMATLAIALRDTPLAPFENYVQESLQLSIIGGTLDGDLQLDYGESIPGMLKLSGGLAIDSLDTFDLADERPWIKWQQLAVTELDYTLEPGSVSIKKVELLKPDVTFAVYKGGETRLSRMQVNHEPTGAAKQADTDLRSSAAADTIFPVSIDEFLFVDGTMIYKDSNLPLDFATRIHKLNGQTKNISTTSTTPMQLTLKGRIDRHGLASIRAKTLLSSPQKFTELDLEFQNIDIASATPYSGKFAGHAIDSGDLSLDISYRINEGIMKGDNHILLEKLTLGEKIDSDDAASLPLRLAVGLLKDINGNIDLDLPVEGDLNNPEVHIGGIVWKAFTGLIVKIVASPFKMLGGLFADDTGDLQSVTFAAGTAELSAVETEQLGHLLDGLVQKPTLVLEINGCIDPEADRLAMKTTQFTTAYQTKVDDDSPSLKQQGKALKALYIEKFSKEKFNQLKDSFKQQVADADPATQSKDELALRLNQDIREQLIEAEQVSNQALPELAMQRANAVYQWLTSATLAGDEALPASRLQLMPSVEEVVESPIGIACPLALTVH